jgi:dGTP triphosphohydrolase
MRRLLCSLMFLAAPAFAGDVGLTEDEFRMYQQYKLALTDARVQAMKPEARAAAIAKDANYKLKDLQRAIEKGEAAGDVKAKCEAHLKEAFEKGELAGRIGRLEVDTTAAQAVAYVQWFNEEQKNLPVEASFAAAKAAEACPIASTVTVWAQDKNAPKLRVFQALVSSASARRISVDRVKDFAETRYMKLFEKVKSVANGDDLSAESGTPTAQP